MAKEPKPLRKVALSASCKYCKRPTKRITLLSSPPGETPLEELFRKERLVAVVCDYCDRYSDMPTRRREQESEAEA